jgi:hypothetical protein
MNREAVAVAADCTLTTFTPDGTKHLRTVDKVFPLVNDPPAVLMVYGSMNLAGVPWRTLAAGYSPPQPFARLDDLADNFLFSLPGTRLVRENLGPPEWLRCLTAVFEETLPLDTSDWKKLEHCDERDQEILDDLFDQIDCLSRQPWLDGVNGQTAESQLALNDTYYDEVLADVPRGRPGLETIRLCLKTILALSTTCRTTGSHASGLVIAGFGYEDAFPGVVEVPCVTVERDSVRRSCPEHIPVTTADPAHLLSYAQDDEVRAFRDGINPELEEALDEEWDDSRLVLQAVGRALDDVMNKMTDVLRLLPATKVPYAVHDAMAALRTSHSDTVALLHQLRTMRQGGAPSRLDRSFTDFTSPVLSGMQHLPPKDLGALAENMVTRASWRHRLDINRTESVGDLVKVAILSRSGGIEWGGASVTP